MAGKTVREPAREIPALDEVDVLVVGGGPAGVCAAVAAARAGARTFLVEVNACLGGMWTAGLVLTLAGYNAWLRPYQRCVAGVPAEWLARATAQGGAEDNDGWVLNSDPETMKRVADGLLEEAGVRCLLHTWGAQPIVEDACVRGVYVENVDGRGAILARVTVDCTGNGDVVVRSGAAWEKSPVLQPMSLCFRMGSVAPDPSVDIAAPLRIPIGPEPGPLEEPLLSEYASRRNDVHYDATAMRAARARGELPPYGGPWFGGLEKDIVWANTVRVYGDASQAADLTRAEIRGRRDAEALVSYFQAHFPGFGEVRLLHTGMQIGIRETRRLAGTYVLTGDDIKAETPFADSVAVGCWPIDVHPSAGEVGSHVLYVPRPFPIPYRALLPKEIGGLLVAGRCISTDREALGSIRVGATCAATGQAAGVAAALAARQGERPAAVDARRLREHLLEQGAIVDPPRC